MKYLSNVFLISVLTLFVNVNIAIASKNMSSTAKQAIIVDFDTGRVLFEKNADEKMPTSSMSKVMSMYLVFEALKKGDLSLDDEFLVSEKAWKKGGSKMFVPVGKKVKIKDLIRGVIVQSGNDATIVLAEGLAGSEDDFAHALNKKAKDLGMTNSHFINASGWPDPNHYSTARDLSKLTISLIKNFPEYYKIFSEKEFTFSNIKQSNRNPLLYKGIGADGVKTGHTEDGGYGLIGSAVSKDGRRVVMVLNGMASKKERKEEATRLMQWALNGFKKISLFDNGKILGDAKVYLGVKSKVGLVVKEPVTVIVPKIYASDVKVEITYKSPLKAPIIKGQLVGTARIYAPKSDVVEMPLLAANDVAELGFFAKIIKKSRILTTGQGKFK